MTDLNTNEAIAKTVSGGIGGTMASPASFLFGEAYATKVNGKPFSPHCPKFWANGSQPPKPRMPGGVFLEAAKSGGINPLSYGLGQAIASKIEKPELASVISGAIGGVLQGTFDRTPKSSAKNLIPGHGLRLGALFGTNQLLDTLNPQEKPTVTWQATKCVVAAAVAKPFNDAVIHIKSGDNINKAIRKIIEGGAKSYKAGICPRVGSASTALFGCIEGQKRFTGFVRDSLEVSR